MAERSFRFLHAADFHLEQPCHGLADAPEHLRSVLIEAPYRSAEKVFDVALAERVDFVILAGDLLDVSRAGPNGAKFLTEQFARLDRRDMPVYWASSRLDAPERWPLGCRLPGNVHRLVTRRQETQIFARDGAPLAWITVMPHLEMERPKLHGVPLEREELRHIVVAHGDYTLTELPDRVDYFALGGKHQRESLREEDSVAHYPGTPQGRSFAEAGQRGCTLVHVPPLAAPRITFVPTATLLWQEESLAVDELMTSERLERLLRERTAGLSVAHPECDQWIRWRLFGAGPLLRRLRGGALAADILGTLREQFGHTRPTAWTESLDVRSAAWRLAQPETDTLLGEYLYALRRLRDETQQPVDLRPYVSDEHSPEIMHNAAVVIDDPRRDALLDDAAALGIDLLGAAEETP